MKSKASTMLKLCMVLLPLLCGCRGMGTQKFTAYGPSQARDLESKSKTVLDVTCVHVQRQADYNLWENLHMLAPIPKRTKLDITFQVRRVVKGRFDDHNFQVHWLRSPTKEQSELLGLPYHGGIDHGFTNGMPLRIGFDQRAGDQLSNIRIVTGQ